MYQFDFNGKTLKEIRGKETIQDLVALDIITSSKKYDIDILVAQKREKGKLQYIFRLLNLRDGVKKQPDQPDVLLAE